VSFRAHRIVSPMVTLTLPDTTGSETETPDQQPLAPSTPTVQVENTQATVRNRLDDLGPLEDMEPDAMQLGIGAGFFGTSGFRDLQRGTDTEGGL
jgi:hypothetical protein